MRVASALEEVVRKQADARANVINDGEMSKPNYATYIRDTTPRLSVPHYSLGVFNPICPAYRQRDNRAGRASY
jgi:hypothetical protein